MGKNIGGSALRIGLVGCGGMGRRHLDGYRLLRDAGGRSFEIAAVCDPEPRAAAAAAAFAEAVLGTRPVVFEAVGDLVASATVQALDVATDPGPITSSRFPRCSRVCTCSARSRSG